VVDHIDNDKANNPEDGTNWQLLCDSCNIKKNPRGPQKSSMFSSHKHLNLSHKREIENLKVRYMTMAKNLAAEPTFRQFTERTLKTHGALKKSELLNAGAEDFHLKTGETISQQALAKYLDKWTNRLNGWLECFRDSEEDWAIRLRT
jgi:hypothetical protein